MKTSVKQRRPRPLSHTTVTYNETLITTLRVHRVCTNWPDYFIIYANCQTTTLKTSNCLNNLFKLPFYTLTTNNEYLIQKDRPPEH